MKNYLLSTMAARISALLMINNNSFAYNKRPLDQKPPSDSKTTISRNVIINGVRLADEDVYNLEQRYNIKVWDGVYWYDPMCGAWGLQGGPCIGVGQPGLKLGGPLKADASNGNTGVFVNGRQLHMLDVLALQLFTVVIPGRYWVNAQGDFGYIGWPRMGNLRQLVLVAGGNASSTIYGKFGTLSEVGWTGNTIGGADPYFRQ